MAAQANPMDYALYVAAGLVVAYILWEGFKRKPSVSPYE